MLYMILFAGPVGAGKTTAIASVSDTEVVQTDAKATDEVAERKDQTTVAMDYGTLEVDTGLTIQLIGTPGQERFDFMWDIRPMEPWGLWLLIDNARRRAALRSAGLPEQLPQTSGAAWRQRVSSELPA